MPHFTQDTSKAEEVFSVAYYSGRGRLFVVQIGEEQPGRRPFLVYFHDEGKEPRYYESHRTLANAQTAARWMADGL